MMQAMRDKVKLIYWIVIISFVGLMFLVWGIGLDEGGGGPRNSGRPVVAMVNDRPIYYEDWTSLSNSILGQMRQSRADGEVTENEIERARQQAYDQLVTDTLQRIEAEKMGIKVTDDEIVDMLSNNPPSYLLEQFRQADGSIDFEGYYAALNDPNIPWRRIEDGMRQSLPLEKLRQRVAGRALVGETEIRQAYAEENTRMVAEYIGVPFSDIELDEPQFSDAEIEAYYQAHLADYELPPRATVRYVVMEKAASESDEQEIEELLETIRQEILDGDTTFSSAASSYSEDTTSSSDGDLGFIDRNRMVEEFTEAAFALPVGEISEPVKTQFGYHLIQVTDEQLGEDGKREQVQVSHLLLKLRPSQETIDNLRERFYAFYEVAEVEGLDAAAGEFGLEVVESEPFQKSLNVPGIPNSLAGSAFAFSHDPGSLSPVFESNDRFYVTEVFQRLAAGHRPLDEVRSLVQNALQREKRAELASERLAEAWQKVLGGSSLEDAASAAGLTYAVTDTFTLRQNITGIGFATPFAEAALELEVEGMAGNVRTQRGVYGLKLVYKSAFDEADFQSKRAQIGSSLLFNRQRQVLDEWLAGLEEKAVIEDRRAELM